MHQCDVRLVDFQIDSVAKSACVCPCVRVRACALGVLTGSAPVCFSPDQFSDQPPYGFLWCESRGSELSGFAFLLLQEIHTKL